MPDFENSSHDNISISIARPEDAEEIAELARVTFAETFVGKAYYTVEIIDDYAKKALSPGMFRECLGDPQHQLFLAKINGETAGFAHLASREPAECVRSLHAMYLNRLYFRKEFHRRGLGTILLNQCIEEAKRRQYDWIWLSVWEHNTPAIAFYERFGFTHFGEWEWPFESLGVKYVDRDLIYAIRI